VTDQPENQESLPIDNLDDVKIADIKKLEGDDMLERTLQRIKREVEQPREAVSGFSSAV